MQGAIRRLLHVVKGYFVNPDKHVLELEDNDLDLTQVQGDIVLRN